MSTSRRATRIAVLGAAAAVVVSGLTVGASAPALAAAVLPAPAASSLSPDSTVDAHKNVELTWAPVSGATSYDVQLLDDDDVDLATIENAVSVTNRYAVPVALPTGEYRWRVRARSGSSTGPWSSLATLTRGWERQVTGLTTKPGRVPTFSWDALPDASFYELEVSRKPFTSATYSRKDSFVCWTAQTTFAPYGTVLGGSVFDAAPGDMASCAFGAGSDGVADPLTSYVYGHQYYWRVRGRDGSVDTRTTAFAQAPGACVGPWLPSGLTVEDKDADGVGDVVTVPIGGTDTVPTAAAAPECSTWSEGATFTPTSPGWAVATVDAPSGLSVSPLVTGSTTQVSAVPTFSWSPVDNALKYRFYLSRDRTVGSLDFAAETQATSLTPVAGLGLRSTARYWAVQACSVTTLTPTDPKDPTTQIDCGPISEPRAITQVTQNPATPESLQVRDGYLLATWTTTPEGVVATPRSQAKAYDVVLRNTETGAQLAPVRTDRIADNVDGATSSLVVPSAALAEGRYTFQVRPVDQSDQVTAWSAPSPSAPVDRAAPTVRLSGAGNVSGRTPVTLTFSEPVTGATAATVAVQDGRGRVAGTLAWTTSTAASFTPSAPWLTGGYLSAWSSGGAVDRAGKPVTAVGGSVRAGTTADSAAEAVAFTAGDRPWVTRTASDAVGRSFRSTTDLAVTPQRASASVPFYGSSVAVGVCKSPTSGSVGVFVDGRYVRTVSLNRSWTGCDVSIPMSGLVKGAHRVTLVAVAGAAGGEVGLDRITVG